MANEIAEAGETSVTRARIHVLRDGRLHLQDGPIDLIVEAHGAPGEVRTAYQAAQSRFVTILDELCAELALLRSPVSAKSARPNGLIAARMFAAVQAYSRRRFITPMAAVAGAVAESVLAAMTNATTLDRAYVNNGGDIALYLASGHKFTIGMVDRPDQPSLFGSLEIPADLPVRGIATSGWRGRSFSLGIADAVTVLAAKAADADAAATILGNAVDLPGHAAITRAPANEIAPDSDLVDFLVTRDVGSLKPSEIEQALDAGAILAEELQASGLIYAAALHLQGITRVVSAHTLTAALDFPQRSLLHA